MTNIFSNFKPQIKSAASVPELLCFALLFVGLMIILVPSSQRRQPLVPVTARHSVTAKSNIIVAVKTALALNRTHSTVR